MTSQGGFLKGSANLRLNQQLRSLRSFPLSAPNEETTKFERKFIKDLRLMLEGHIQRNLMEYKRALRARIHRLKREKLKRLMTLRSQGARHAKP
jgi:hypothetical protein